MLHLHSHRFHQLSLRYLVCDFLTELRRDCLPLYSMCLRGRHLQAVEQMWVRQEVIFRVELESLKVGKAEKGDIGFAISLLAKEEL